MFNLETDRRFKIVYEQGEAPCYKILVDTVTGVNYLYVCGDVYSGLTVMVDQNGKPVVTAENEC